jgi:hypothetical protein
MANFNVFHACKDGEGGDSILFMNANMHLQIGFVQCMNACNATEVACFTIGWNSKETL